MSSITRLSLALRPPSCPWIRRRLLTEWIGLFVFGSLSILASAHPSSRGCDFSKLTSAVPFSSMVSDLPLALCHLHRSSSSQSSRTSLYCRFKTPRHFPTFTHTLYADDTSAISVSDAATLAVFDTYDTFEGGTGSKLNLSKCESLWLGTGRNRIDTPVAIAWTSSKIKVLGVFLGNGNLDEENWRPRIDAVE